MVAAGRLLIAPALLAAAAAFSQEPSVSARVDTSAFVVGEQIRLTVSVEHAPGDTVRNVGPADSLAGLEIVARGEPERSSADGRVLERIPFTVTAFDSGARVIPPFAVYYTGAGDTAVRSALTSPVAVFVRGVEVDTAADIRGIKPPMGVPITFMEVLPYLLALLAAAGLVRLAYIVMKKRRKGEGFIPGPPPRPPHEVALEALRALESEKLWQRGRVKEYYSGVSDILRAYIERRYAVPAMESTSDETLGFVPIRSLPGSEHDTLRGILIRSDLVKFAKFIPPEVEHESSMTGAVAFVERTRGAEPADPGTPEGVEKG